MGYVTVGVTPPTRGMTEAAKKCALELVEAIRQNEVGSWFQVSDFPSLDVKLPTFMNAVSKHLQDGYSLRCRRSGENLYLRVVAKKNETDSID